MFEVIEGSNRGCKFKDVDVLAVVFRVMVIVKRIRIMEGFGSAFLFVL